MNCRNHILKPLLTGLFVLVLANSADAATMNVPADYSTIQGAVNAAAAGDTILVQSGTYYENVVVNKALTLQGVDSGSGLPVVNASGSGSAITLSADSCTLQGFVANESSEAGIKVTSSGNTITDNTIFGNTATGNTLYGILLDSSSGNTISGNTATATGKGIYLYFSSNSNIVTSNTVTGNSDCGIYFYSSSGNTISDNTATGSAYCGIYLISSSGNTISDNTATGNGYYGILLDSSSGNTISDNTATRNSVGIYLYSSSNSNTLSGNTATGNTESGIYLVSSSNSTVSGNNATGNSQYGIFLDSSSNSNTIFGNTAVGNYYGIAIRSSSNDNTISGNTATSNTQYGILLDSSSGNSISDNSATRNSNGIYLYSSSNNTISGNTATGNSNGVYLYSSSGNTISDNTATGNSYCGIYLYSSSGNTISDNTATGNSYYGILLDSSSSNRITGNTATGNSNGIYLYSSSNSNTLSGNIVTGNTESGIYLVSSSNSTVSANNATGNAQYGIFLDSSSNSNTILGNTAFGNYYGIAIRSSSIDNTISSNNATGNTLYGILLDSSSGNTISDNSANGNSNGIYLYFSSIGNTVSGNTATGNSGYGILLDSSSDNTISGNTATSNSIGIYFYSCSGNTISDNSATGNTQYGILLDSSSGNSIIGNAATGNSNGIYLYSSSNSNTLSGNTATSNTESGIYLVSSGNSTVSDNNATSNAQYGIFLYSSSGNIISDNSATGNGYYGIALRSSSNDNSITSNTATDNGYSGILLDSSSGNTISGNTATGNSNGIFIYASSGNIIYLNTLDSGWSNGANNWNSTTEIDYGDSTTYVGNNWSDYDGLDCNGDGIGETPYPVAGGSDIDYHPIGGIPCLTCISGYKLNGCGEPLEGWSIFVDSDRSGTLDSGEPANVTNTSGYWQICDLVSGAEVRVAEQAKAGWRASQPSTGWQDTTVQPDNATAYVNFTNIQLLCISGYKLDQSGLPLEDGNITLTNGSYTSTATTDSAGKYEFCGLMPGDYDLSEELQEGWAAVSAPDEVELNCTNVTDQNFVNRRLLCINGTKISNCTGEGIAGWNIKLFSEFGLEMNSTTTHKNGDYSFCNLEPGNYTVCEVLQGGWKNVTARCIEVVLDTGNSEDNDFLNTPPVCISGSKINDCTDQGIPGWKITLYDAAGNVIDDTVTDANGRYSFCNLTPGIYYVCEEKRDGWIPVRGERGSIGPSDDTSQPVTCNMPWCDDNCVCVDLDCNGAQVDFRNIPESLCINGSKINNCTRAGIEKWSIYLYDASGKQIAATQTDRNGHYSFCGLAPGEYRVCEEIRDGYIPVTHINHSGASCLPESCTCDACDNCIPVILDCDNSEENDFENIPPTSIKGKVIDDCTGDGLPGWTVKLYDGATSLTTRTTGNDGSFTFTSSTTSGGLKLTAGKLYTVCEVVQNGYTPVTYHANNNSPPMSNEYCVPVFLDCGETELEDFENIPPLLISGHEFNQCTGDGLDGWSVHLKDGAGNILENTTTDENGYYEFRGRQPGWYTVCEDSIPEGWTSVREDPNSPAMAQPGTSAAPADCETPKCIVVNLDYCEDATDNDFYNIPPFCIKGNVNSTTDDALPANFQVKIENSDGTQIESVPIDENGDYSLCDLKAGTYTVCVNTPGWTADEPCVIVYLDCTDEEHNFDVYKGRNPMVPGIAQPAISLDDSREAMDPGAISDEPSASEKNMRGDEPPAARPSTNPEII